MDSRINQLIAADRLQRDIRAAAAAGNAFDPLAGDHASDEALVLHSEW